VTGAYKIPYSEASFRKTPKERGGADVIVRVYNDQNEVLFTSKKKNNVPAKYELNIQVLTQQYVARGTVKDANGKPLPSMIVRVSERDLRHPQLIAEGPTGPGGDYRFEYRPTDFQLGDLPALRAPWLIVEVRETAEGEAVAKQEVQRADRDQVVSFTLSTVGAISEWQRIGEAVAPLLKGQGAQAIEMSTHETRPDLAPHDITDSDFDFIVIETGFDRAAIQAWATSARMVRDAVSRLTDEHAAQQGILREHGWPFFYGRVRQQGASDLDAMLRDSTSDWQGAWRAARAAQRVPVLNEKHVAMLLDAMQLLQRLQQLDPARNADNQFAKVLALTPLPLPRTVALDALTIVQEKGLDDTDALLKLVERYPEAEAPIKTLVRSIRVHRLASGHEGLTRLLNGRLEGSSDSIAPLARLRAADWIGIAAESGISPGLALRTQAQAERQHPMPALESKLHAGAFDLPKVPGSEVAAFIKNQPAVVEKLLLGKVPVKAEETEVHNTLRNTGRFMRTGISMELGAHLIKGGISSPGKALLYGRDFILQQFLDMPQGAAHEVIDAFFDAAEPLVNGGKGVMLEVDINRRFPRWMMEEYMVPLPEPVRENAPTLAALFGDLDECLCRPCDSMLGQPAYLVDVLNLLGKSNVLWLLRQRRSDIFELKLNCENAEQLVQHIDIVLEILKKAVGTAPYEITASAVYPWRLPFKEQYAETKAYLAKLRVSRFDVLSLRSNPQVNEIAAETLDVSFSQQWPISEWRLLTEERTGADLWQVYGLASFGGSSFPLVDPASGEDLSRKNREDVLTRVSVLIDITGLELDELEQAFKTEFVSGFQGGLTLTNRDQCKTSEMRLTIEGEEGQPSLLEGCLDRLHRFTRLRAKLPGWSIAQLGNAIKACDGIEAINPPSTPQERENTLIKLAIIKRLHDEYRMPLEFPYDRVISESSLRKMLGLSPLQIALLKALTAIDPTAATTQSFNWAALEEFCKAAKRIRESGLSIEQVAQALLPRGELIRLAGELPPMIKTDEQIEKLLIAIQQRVRSVVAIRADITLESQVTEALSEIYDAVTADTLVQAMRDAGAEDVSERVAHPDLVPLLHGDARARADRKLGEWLPLLDVVQAEKILMPASNLDAEDRFNNVLQGCAARRRERELIAVLAEQSGLAESEVIPLLGARLPLDASTPAATEFLSTNFWADIPATQTTPPRVPSITVTDVPRLHAWMDGLYRLIALSTALQIDRELMLLADRVTVGSTTGISWRDILATLPATGSAWTNPNWQALLDLVWLQQPEQLSRQTLSELLSRLEGRGTNSVQEQTLRPLATRLGIAEAHTLAITAHAVATVDAQTLRNPTQLRRAFELLLLARHLGANDTQLTHLANLGDSVQTATTAKVLLEGRIGGQEHKEVWRDINDKLLQQRRDALVAYLVGNVRLDTRQYKKFNNANDLYEYYLIDPQMEPCFETTRVLEAITAAQLFAQRLLFGLEAGQLAIKELKARWPWMRNYRVWEANRKVFLFPENWLFPELRDDKSSSFKQLESGLGQGELTQELANQAFGQFLDDVAQMGQVQVLGMFEDISRDASGNILKDNSNRYPLRRTLYVIGRNLNPPYAYFWRHCVDFGSPHMEWSPWQRIELDIQGDHVLPFVLNGQFHVAWPKFQRNDPKDKPDLLELRMYWSKLNGATWDRAENSREPIGVFIPAFQDERTGYSFRCQKITDAITLICYRRASSENLVSSKSQEIIDERLRQLDRDIRNEFNAQCMREQYHSFGHLVVPAYENHPLEVRGVQGGQPIGADVIGAVLIVAWEVWVQAQDMNGAVGYVRLDSDERSRVKFLIDATIDGKPCFSQRIGDSIGIWVVSYQSPSVPDVHFSVRVDGVVNTGSVQLVSGVTAGDIKETRLRFVCGFNASDIPTLADLGVESSNRFDPVCQFVMRANGRRSWQSPYQQQEAIPLLNGFRVFMNGQEASTTALPITLQGESGQGGVTPFQRPFRATGTIWLTGSNSHRQPTAAPSVWFYRDENESCLLDTGGSHSSSGLKFNAIAFNYDDADKYRQVWHDGVDLFKFDPAWGRFGADELPDLSMAGDTTSWESQRAGEMAFNADMPYACYNWEVFFHAPLLIADQLSKQHKFEDAERWLRFVFDPTSSEDGLDAKRFLKFRVFRELDLNQQVIDDLTVLAQVAGGYGDPDSIEAVQKLIGRWRDMPFRPYVIARRRHIAFLWRTLFAYLDNLIAWADSLYRRDTRESINEATMLYVLAERILGRRPQLHQSTSSREAHTYDEKIAKWDEFANFWIDVGAQGESHLQTAWRLKDSINQPNPDGMLYFCMPFNDKILSYWNTVDARLGNIRNCRNIEGIRRSLPLMDAPIDPELLIRATAAGLNVSEVISGLYAPPPHYRYSILSSRAAELANECKSLGAAMLSAIEKRDAEHLAQLRSSNEINLLKLVRDVRTLQITEAEGNIEALRASRKSIEARHGQYQRLLGKKDITVPEEQTGAGEETMLGSVGSALASNRSSLGLLKEEEEQYVGFIEASGWSTAAGIARTASGVTHLVAAPAFASIVTEGGAKIATAVAHGLTAAGEAFSTVSQAWRSHVEQQGMLAGHIRRRDEWAFQSNQALKELQQIDKQILANHIRIDITKKELDNHIEQIEQAKAVDEVMRSKFSNVQLYEWMKTELSRLYFHAYRMALDMARRAERAASRELGVKPLNILGNACWDSLRDGLLAGERLHQDLKRIEIAYLDQNRREYELTKHISLRRLKPEALVNLRVKNTDGECTCQFDIPEWLFDLDTPGQYLRRIKSVSVSMPSVTGPYTSVNCKLTLLKSEVRHERSLKEGNRYIRLDAADDDRFTDYFGATEAIVTSTGNADSGMFETQLRDERFLPFEGSGVISTWRLELPAEYPQFDYLTISDVVLTIRYTAREGGDTLRAAATAAIETQLKLPASGSDPKPLRFPVLLSCRSDFPTEWARAKTNHQAKLEIQNTRSLLPYWMEAARIGTGTDMKQLQVLKVSTADLSIAPPSPPAMSEFKEISSSTTGMVWDLGTVPNDTTDRFVLLSVGLPG